jgi:hypothetical protein
MEESVTEEEPVTSWPIRSRKKEILEKVRSGSISQGHSLVELHPSGPYLLSLFIVFLTPP